MNSPTGQTRRRIFTLDGSNDADSRKDVPFGGFVDNWHCSPFCGWNPPKTPILGAWIGVFKRNGQKYWKFHVIETTASISTEFCTTMETIKWSWWVVPIGAQEIQDGGRPLFWKKVKSPYLCKRLIDFDNIWYSDAYYPRTADLPLKFRIIENRRWRRPPSWKITKIAISLHRFDRSLRNLVPWCKMGLLTAPTLKNFEFHKCKMADGRHFKNR